MELDLAIFIGLLENKVAYKVNHPPLVVRIKCFLEDSSAKINDNCNADKLELRTVAHKNTL